MAINVQNVTELVDLPGGGPQGTRILTASITLDTSYPTGGSGGLLNALRVNKILAVVPMKSLGYDFDYDIPTDKLKTYQQPAAAAAGASPEVPNATNLSGVGALPVLVIAQ